MATKKTAKKPVAVKAKKPAAKKAAPPPKKKAPAAKKKPEPKKVAPPVEKKVQEKAAAKVVPEAAIITPVAFADLRVVDNIREDMGDVENLAISIRTIGLREPLMGYIIRSGSDKGKLAITDGHRRYEAIKSMVKADRDAVNITMQLEDGEVTAIDRVLGMLVFGDGKKLTMLEEATGIQRIMVKQGDGSLGKTKKEVADAIGKTEQHVSDCNLLLTASKAILKLVRKGEVAPTAVINTIRDHDGDMDAVLGALVKGAERAGPGKKVTPKHIDKKKTSNTLSDLKDMELELEALQAPGMSMRMRSLKLCIAFLANEISKKKFLATFFEKVDAKAPEPDAEDDSEDDEDDEDDTEDDNDGE